MHRSRSWCRRCGSTNGSGEQSFYMDNLEDCVAGRGMTVKTKIRSMVTVTLLMSISFIMMCAKGIALGCVWAFHIIYFCFGVKKIPADS